MYIVIPKSVEQEYSHTWFFSKVTKSDLLQVLGRLMEVVGIFWWYYGVFMILYMVLH